MRNLIIGYYSLFLGITIIILWIFLLMMKSYSEPLIELIFHVISEMIMASICIIGGFFTIKRDKLGPPFNVIAHSMITYSVLNAAGFYAEKDEILVLWIFIVLLFISVTIVGKYIICFRVTYFTNQDEKN